MAACAITIVKTVVFEWFHFFHLFIDFVSRGMVLGHILVIGTLGTTLVIQGSRGTPNGHIGVKQSIFIGFRVHLGSLLGVILETFLRFV